MDQDRSSISWVARAQRHGLDLPVFVYTRDDRRVPALVTDLSYDGCQLRAHDGFTISERLTIVHAQVGEVSGQVKWIKEGSVGIEFDH